ncbi:MAG: hypothetical protein ABTQ28_05315, partial [Thauera sp.]
MSLQLSAPEPLAATHVLDEFACGEIHRASRSVAVRGLATPPRIDPLPLHAHHLLQGMQDLG